MMYQPAFPFHITNDDIEPGLTKRELFAAMAMQGMMAKSDWCYGSDGVTDEATGISIGEFAVRAADALIAELDKDKPDAD